MNFTNQYKKKLLEKQIKQIKLINQKKQYEAHKKAITFWMNKN